MTLDLNELLKGAGSIAIAGHVRPDGDAVGSTLALYNYIKKEYPDKEVSLFLDNPKSIYAHLTGYDEIKNFHIALKIISVVKYYMPQSLQFNLKVII